MSIFDEAALSSAFSGHGAVINLATAIPPSSKFKNAGAWKNNDLIRTEGSRIVIDAVKKAAIPRVIQESVSMIYRDQRAQWIDEEGPTEQLPMAVGNQAAEASANRFTGEGGIGVVLRFGWFYGPGVTHSEEFFELARRWSIGIMMGESDTYLISVHVEDGGCAVVDALNVPAGTYNAVDDEQVTKSEDADAKAASVERKVLFKAPG